MQVVDSFLHETMIYKFITLLVLTSCYAAKFPSNWATCKLNDPQHNECLRGAIQGTLDDLVKGMPQLGIKSVDPLHFERMSVQQGNGPFSVNLTFIDFDMLGMQAGTVDKIQNDQWKRMLVDVSVPKLRVKGKYAIKGKVLVLPIFGSGDCELIIENFKGKLDITYKEIKKGGKIYYNMDTFKVDASCDNFIQKYENLFDGNKQLGDQMNVFLNENGKDIFNELKKPFFDALGEGFRQLANRLFNKIPKDEITPP